MAIKRTVSKYREANNEEDQIPESELPLTNEGMAEAEAAVDDSEIEVPKKDVDKIVDIISKWAEPEEEDDEEDEEKKEEARDTVRLLKKALRENKLHESYVIMGYDKDDNDVFYQAGKGWVTENPTIYDSLDAANKDIATAKKDAKPAEIDDIAPVDSRLAESKKRAPKSWKEAKENIRKRLNEDKTLGWYDEEICYKQTPSGKVVPVRVSKDKNGNVTEKPLDSDSQSYQDAMDYYDEKLKGKNENRKRSRKLVREDVEELSEYQKGCIQDMARMDFDVGHPMSSDDYNEIVGMMREDEDLCDVAELAADYYLEITADGAPSFYNEFGPSADVETSSTLDDNDFDEDDDPLFGYGESDEVNIDDDDILYDDIDFMESKKKKSRIHEGLTSDQKKSIEDLVKSDTEVSGNSIDRADVSSYYLNELVPEYGEDEGWTPELKDEFVDYYFDVRKGLINESKKRMKEDFNDVQEIYDMADRLLGKPVDGEIHDLNGFDVSVEAETNEDGSEPCAVVEVTDRDSGEVVNSFTAYDEDDFKRNLGLARNFNGFGA